MLPNLEDTGKLLLRLLLGVLLLLHGLHKIVDGPGEVEGMLVAHNLPAMLAYGVYLGEVLAPVLLILGLYARLGGLLVVGNMVVAVLLTRGIDIFHRNPYGGWAIELEVFYGVCGLIVMLLGAGRYSVAGTKSKWN
jgi:putative oxidoreductase